MRVLLILLLIFLVEFGIFILDDLAHPDLR